VRPLRHVRPGGPVPHSIATRNPERRSLLQRTHAAINRSIAAVGTTAVLASTICLSSQRPSETCNYSPRSLSKTTDSWRGFNANRDQPHCVDRPRLLAWEPNAHYVLRWIAGARLQVRAPDANVCAMCDASISMNQGARREINELISRPRGTPTVRCVAGYGKAPPICDPRARQGL